MIISKNWIFLIIACGRGDSVDPGPEYEAKSAVKDADELSDVEKDVLDEIVQEIKDTLTGKEETY